MTAWVTATLLVLGCVTILWLLSLALRDASIIDAFWGLGFVIAVWVGRLLGGPALAGHWLPLLLVTLWGLRLSAYIAWRNLGKGEDYRYRAMRERHGDRFAWVSLFTVFLLQGVLIALLAPPLLAVQLAPQGARGPFAMLGVLCWLVGFLFEAGGDWQLARFRADPANRGRVLDRGFWAFTRHPNYFGDAAQWWGYGLFALAADAPWTLYAPALMTLLLLRVSGVSLLEKTIVERRPEYRRYIESTSAFLPWLPRRRSRA